MLIKYKRPIGPGEFADEIQLSHFDLDGTILNTLEDLKRSLNFALRSCRLPPRSLNEVRRFVGNGIGRLIERGVPIGTPADQMQEVLTVFHAHYEVHCADHTQPYTGIPELLCALRAGGVQTAVVSNKADYAVQTLCRQYFDGLFDRCAGVRERPKAQALSRYGGTSADLPPSP